MNTKRTTMTDPLAALKALTETPESPLDQLEHLHEEVAKRPTLDLVEAHYNPDGSTTINPYTWGPDGELIQMTDAEYRASQLAGEGGYVQSMVKTDPELVRKQAEAVAEHSARVRPNNEVEAERDRDTTRSHRRGWR